MDDIIRIGFISSINAEDGSAKITYQDRDKMVTEDFPFLAFGGRSEEHTSELQSP